MKFIYSIILYILFQCSVFNANSQRNKIIIKAWAIEEEIFGGTPPPEFQKAMFRKSTRFFLETLPNYKVKIINVFIGETPFAVFDEHQSKSSPSRDYKPSDFNIKNTFIQVLITDTLRLNSLRIPFDHIMHNQAVIVYSINTNKHYYFPIKTIVHERINLP